MVLNLLPEVRTPEQLVRWLADPHRSVAAFTRLLALGADTGPVIRAGLRHPHPLVRENCCRLLDHLMDADSVADLIAMLGDPEPRVRIAATHALACDRCKRDDCRPSAADILPRAEDLLANDPDPQVRARAAELVGRWVHQVDSAISALERARAHDTDPSVRKKAGWYLPGGPIYRRTAPRTQRKAM